MEEDQAAVISTPCPMSRGFDPDKVPVGLMERLYRYRAVQDQRLWPSPKPEICPNRPGPAKESGVPGYG